MQGKSGCLGSDAGVPQVAGRLLQACPENELHRSGTGETQRITGKFADDLVFVSSSRLDDVSFAFELPNSCLALQDPVRDDRNFRDNILDLQASHPLLV